MPFFTNNRWPRLAGAGCVAVALAGCNQLGFGRNPETSLAAPGAPVHAPLQAGNIGEGPVHIALILPMTQGSGPSAVGNSLRNAAELAITDSATTDLTIFVKDDHSSAEGARNAAQEAVNEGAELILGPLFAADVREVGQVARAANKPVIAFSTDTSVAARNVYLLSFLIETYVDRIVDFASQRGKRSFAALVPESDYGNVALAEFQAATARAGVRVLTIERYTPGSAAAAVQRIAALGDQIDALFIPEQAEGMVAVSQALTANAINGQRVQLLGIGVWNDARILKLPALQGAWFAAPENTGFNSFAQRYRARFGTEPTRIATLSYDAVSLAAALARAQGPTGFSEAVLTNASGFNGADGVFRFRPDGLNERGLSVLQIGNGGAMTISPAPKSFGGGKS